MSFSEPPDDQRFNFNQISHLSRPFLPWWSGDIEAELGPTSFQQHKSTLCESCENITLAALESQQGYMHDGKALEQSAQASNACGLCFLIRDALISAHEEFGTLHETEKALSDVLKRANQRVKLSAMAKTDISIGLDPPHRDFPDLATLSLYTTPGSPSAGLTDHFTKCTTDNEAVYLAAHWISQCFISHPKCPKAIEVPLPKRLIDVGPSNSAPSLRLWKNPCYSTARDKYDAPLTGTYLALSYCWGLSPFTVLSPQNQEMMEQEIEMSLLPKTIQDAIRITRLLHVRFLWVDSLCILQGSSSEAQEDWKEQSLQMAAIYQQAALTIGASTSEGAHDGIKHFEKYKGCFVKLPTSWSSLVSHNPMYVGPNAHSLAFPFHRKLHTRAWTHQERLLSTRYITFGQGGMLWECAQARIADNAQDLDYSYDRRSLAIRLPSTPTYIDWHHIVADYSTMELTRSSDKLVAIASLREQFMQLRSNQDLDVAGLWADNLSWDMLWQRALFVPDATPHAKGCIAPTWSWASM
ncbi:heterokaryon incompatibility protein-domain-containing protein, partial [Macrophomina phaseolina]